MTDIEAPDAPASPDGHGIKVNSFSDEMSRAYLDYSMSVIVSRALPDVRDGFKPVHRRIIYAMEQGKFTAGRPFNKAARIVGDVIGKYHPHGDQSVYHAQVRMAQPWSLRHTLIEGQGNFGSMDGDQPAAMRYTEVKMSRLAMDLIHDLHKGTVGWRPNYDGKEVEPVVLPARFPNILVNGGTGIAVGMATNIPTHNLREAIDACLLVLDNPGATLDDVMEIMPGPDFPTHGVIMGRGGIRKAYETGRGSIIVSGVATVEQAKRGREQIVITEIPYGVVKAQLITRIVELVHDKKIEGISDVRDETGRGDEENKVRIVIDVKQDADGEIVLNHLRKLTDFQSSYGYNATCLDTLGAPREMPLMDILQEFVAFRRHTVRARTQFELDDTRASQIKQIGLYVAVSMIDEVVRVIRHSPDADAARVRLMEMDFPVDSELQEIILESDPDSERKDTMRLSDVQAKAILELSLRRLTGLERDNIIAQVLEYQKQIRVYLEILGNPDVLDGVVRREMEAIRETHGEPRRTVITTSEADEIDDESLVERKDVIVTLTNTGYVKRTEIAAYRAQRRGGKGRIGMETKEDDYVISTIVCTTRTPLLVFTSRGQVYSLKTFRLPEAGANAKGRPIINFIANGLAPGEKVTSLVPMPEDREAFAHKSLVFVTDFGTIRRNSVTEFMDIKKNGKIAMKLEAGDGGTLGRLVAVMLADNSEDVMISTHKGQSVRCPVDDVRVFRGRDSVGVRAISLKDQDFVVSACVLAHSDADSMERDVYLSDGIAFIREADLLDANNNPRVTAPSLSFEPKPTEEKPDRVMAVMSPDRMVEMRATESFLLTVSENGYGKRTSSHEYRVVSRGGLGIAAAAMTEKTGNLVACLPVEQEDGLVLVTDGGVTIRTRVADISVLGRSSQGVRLFDVADGQKIVGVARVPADDDSDDGTEDQGQATEAAPNQDVAE
jgi:DNA gyrase, A subunit